MNKVGGSPGPSYRGPAVAIAFVIFFALVLLVVHSGAKSSAPPPRGAKSGQSAGSSGSVSGSTASSGSSSSAGSAAGQGAAARGGRSPGDNAHPGAQLPNTGSPFPSWWGFLPLLLAATLIVSLRQRAARAERIGIVERDERPEVIELPLSLEEVEVARAGERWFDPYYDADDDHLDDFALGPGGLYTGSRRP